MFKFLQTLVGAFTGDVAEQLAKAYASKNNAETEQQRIQADLKISELLNRQKNRELGGKLTAWVQAIWAAPFIIYTWKLVVWDKVFAAGTTDALSSDLLNMQMRIITLYFGGAIGVGVIRALRK